MNRAMSAPKILSVIKTIYLELDGQHRRRGLWLFILMALRAVVETASVAVIAIYAAAISNPSLALQTTYMDWVRQWFGLPLSTDIKIFLLWLSVAVVIIILIKNVMGGRLIYAISRFSADSEAFFGHRLLTGFLNRDYQWHLGKNSADIVQTMQWRVYLGRFFVTPVLKIVSEIIVLIFLVVALLWIQPFVSLLFFLIQGGASFIFYHKLRRNLDLKSEACKERERTISREVTKAVHGFKDVRISGTERHFINDFDRQAVPFAKDFSWQQFWKEAPLLTLESVGFILISVTILFMLYALNYSPLEITGTTALLAVTAWRSLPSVNRILGGMTSIRTALPYIRNVLKELEVAQNDLIAESDNDPQILSFEKEIVVEGIGFYYAEHSDHDVLRSINLTIPRGRAVGIMGTSGCGKSTLADLLIGLLQPTTGRIVIDGKPLDSGMHRAWVKSIGYVAQSPYIFDGTLAENVAFGIDRELISKERVKECCRLAAVDFLEEISDGVDTLIGERGVRLSGGQRQRVAIARALYNDPPLLIFDEATSALDVENDRRIRSLIGELRGDRTLLVIAHRESTLEMCDLIYAFDKAGELRLIQNVI